MNFTRDYDWNTFRSDLTAGATVAAIAIPQAIAYALIAGVDPRFGLYSAIVITIIASIIGSSSHLINGPTNAISLVVFSALASFDERFASFQALFLLGIIAGTIQILISVFRLGDLTRYVSESVILGFMFGAGLLIGVGQIGNFLGAATILVVLSLRRFINKYKLPRVDLLAGLIIFTLVAAWFGWTSPAGPKGRSLVSVVGAVPAALPSFHIPQIDWNWFGRLLKGALAVSLLGLLEALAVAKSIATYTRQPLDYNRQIVAEGVGNLVGGFFQALPGSGSLTRSAINYQSGAVTRDSGRRPVRLHVLKCFHAGAPDSLERSLRQQSGVAVAGLPHQRVIGRGRQLQRLHPVLRGVRPGRFPRHPQTDSEPRDSLRIRVGCPGGAQQDHHRV